MVIDDFNLVRVVAFPDEADAPLVVDADAVLTGSIPFQGFKAIGWWQPQVIQCFRTIEEDQFAQRRPLNVGGQMARAFALPKLLRLFVTEVLNQPPIL